MSDSSSSSFALYECASGYALFNINYMNDIAFNIDLYSSSNNEEIYNTIANYSNFSKICKLHAFQPFTSAENALENMMKISIGELHDDLISFLQQNLPGGGSSSKKKGSSAVKRAAGSWLGVSGGGIGAAIEAAGISTCRSDQAVLQILRGIRQHFTAFVKALGGGAIEKAQLGLGHAYSRAHVKFNVHRQDNMIIQSIALLDQIDKDLNTISMRLKEWYGWHFPELVKIVPDAYVYARLVKLIGPRNSLFSAVSVLEQGEDGEEDAGSKSASKKRKTRDEDEAIGENAEEILAKITEITLDEELSKQVIATAKTSMGFDISEIDVLCVRNFADRVVALSRYRKNLHSYLLDKMGVVAPNLGALVGETIAARLISHAGSLTRLSKCPASTIQILGAEKALFRALKTKGNTPKYGIIFNTSAIGRASSKNKGRISRYIANKCAIASRIDAFSDEPDPIYGEKLKQQVEERLAFFDTGAVPSKNIDVMVQVKKIKTTHTKNSKKEEDDEELPSKIKKAEKEQDEDEDEDGVDLFASAKKKAKKEKKEKKEKKSKKSKSQDDEDDE